MKTREEVIEYVNKVGHTKEAILKIAGFLIGHNLKEVDEVLKWKIGEGTFDEFYDWFTSEPEALKEVFMPILETLLRSANEKEKSVLTNDDLNKTVVKGFLFFF